MKKISRVIDEKRGIMQTTTSDERWYDRESTNPTTGLREIEFVPSVTYITSFYPKSQALVKWVAEKGLDQAEAIKKAAGDRGSKVHTAIADLIDGKEVKMDAKYVNPSTGQEEELSLEEYECIMSFVAWFKETNPRVVGREFIIWNDQYGYAGTVDFLAQIGNEYWIIDFKTGQSIWPEYTLQVSAYKHAIQSFTSESFEIEEGVDCKLGILQLGYRRNKAGFKFTEVEDKFPLFLSVREVWKNETEGEKPLQRDFPLALSLVEAENLSAVKKQTNGQVKKHIKGA
jgi:hypothetical protein